LIAIKTLRRNKILQHSLQFLQLSLTAMADSSTNPKDHQNTRLYHPYQHLNIPVDKLYNLPTSPEHLFPEEASRKHRSWGDNLQYYTGTGYLSGAIIGGAKGTVEGLKAAESGESLKLRVNRVLNSGGQGGRRFGNSLGVLGLIFAGLESSMIHFRDTDDFVNSAVAGLGTGALYKAAAGPRSAAIAGAIGGIAAAVAVVGKQALKRHIPI
jgi:import inner membrane translocase subunit TIM23